MMNVCMIMVDISSLMVMKRCVYRKKKSLKIKYMCLKQTNHLLLKYSHIAEVNQ